MNLLHEAKQKYPKGYEKFMEWYWKQEISLAFAVPSEIHLNTLSGWLTAFFDGEGICISVMNWNGLADVWDSNVKTKTSGYSMKVARTRSEAFTAAVIKAFEILEERL